MCCRCALIGLFMTAMLIVPIQRALADLGEDIEKPKPEFFVKQNDRIAKLIPRGKSTAIEIRFRLTGASIAAVAAKDFSSKEMPDVDLKNFRSGFFMLQAGDLNPGAEMVVTIGSAYFTTATELWGARSKGSRTWENLGASQKSVGERVNELSLTVKDGGTLDGDGAANGRIDIILAPRDSFWGYALGTLFIRFFGIFLVLSVLMIGMQLSGLVFQWLERRKTKPVAPMQAMEPATVLEEDPKTAILPAQAAAIALALHLGREAERTRPVALVTNGPSTWAAVGRGQLITGRLPVFERLKRRDGERK